MLFKYNLVLRPDSPPHLPIKEFLRLISKDKELLPTTEAMLKALKKAHAQYIPLPLEHLIIVDSTRHITLHKDTKPVAKIWTRMNWSDNDVEEFRKDHTKFIQNILELYRQMGYRISMLPAEDAEVTDILENLETLQQKTLKKIKKLSGRDKDGTNTAHIKN